MTQKQILDEYRLRKTIKSTAKSLQISECVVKKTLITAGLYTTPLTTRIKELRATGMPQQDIAALLNKSHATICANTPYEKTSYLATNKTLNAIKIKQTREKQKQNGF